MINCELFSDVYFAALPIPRSCAYILTHSENLAFGPTSGFKMMTVFNSE